MIVHTIIYTDDNHIEEIPTVKLMTGENLYNILKEYEDAKNEKSKLLILNKFGNKLINDHNINKETATIIIKLIHLCYLYGFIRNSDKYMWYLIESITPRVNINIHDIHASSLLDPQFRSLLSDSDNIEEELKKIIDRYSPLGNTNPLTPINTIDCMYDIISVLNI